MLWQLLSLQRRKRRGISGRSCSWAWGFVAREPHSVKGLPQRSLSLGIFASGLLALGPVVTRRNVAQECQADVCLDPSFPTLGLKLSTLGACFLIHKVGRSHPLCCQFCDLVMAWVCPGKQQQGGSWWCPCPEWWLPVHTGSPPKLGPGLRCVPYLSAYSL